VASISNLQFKLIDVMPKYLKSEKRIGHY